MKLDPQSLSPEARAVIRAQLTRRSLLVGAGAIAGATTLAHVAQVPQRLVQKESLMSAIPKRLFVGPTGRFI